MHTPKGKPNPFVTDPHQAFLIWHCIKMVFQFFIFDTSTGLTGFQYIYDTGNLKMFFCDIHDSPRKLSI
jgi:hypothetical protein